MTGGTWYWILFGLCAAWVIVTGVGVVAFKNVVHAAVSMVMCFLGVAFVYVLLHAELLAIIQILLYVGAISVVILFAIMLTEQQRGKLSLFFNRQSVLALPLVVATMLVLTVYAIAADLPANGSVSNNPSLQTIAESLFNQYVYPFELVSFVLVAAMIGAILLARREDDEP
jgi:NADH-quinone oxidoreductase subunit J